MVVVVGGVGGGGGGGGRGPPCMYESLCLSLSIWWWGEEVLPV